MILQHDGFDHYGSGGLHTANESQTSYISSGYVTPTASVTPSTTHGKNGSIGLGLSGSVTPTLVWIKKPIRPNSKMNEAYTPTGKVVIGFALRFPVALPGRVNFLKMGGVSLAIGTDMLIYIDGVATTYQCEINIWNFCELEIDPAGLKATLFMTNTKVIEKTIAAPTLDFFEIRNQLETGTGAGIYVNVDDLYLLDGKTTDQQGKPTANIARLGKCATITRYPTADVEKGMTPNAGTTNFSRVNTPAPDGDATFVSSNIAGTTDLYSNTTDFTTIDEGAIRAVSIVPSARQVEPDSLGVTAVVKVDAVEAVGYRMALRATSYTTQQHTFESSPKTNAPWTKAEAVNMSFGQRILPPPAP